MGVRQLCFVNFGLEFFQKHVVCVGRNEVLKDDNRLLQIVENVFELLLPPNDFRRLLDKVLICHLIEIYKRNECSNRRQVLNVNTNHQTVKDRFLEHIILDGVLRNGLNQNEVLVYSEVLEGVHLDDHAHHECHGFHHAEPPPFLHAHRRGVIWIAC